MDIANHQRLAPQRDYFSVIALLPEQRNQLLELLERRAMFGVRCAPVRESDALFDHARRRTQTRIPFGRRRRDSGSLVRTKVYLLNYKRGWPHQNTAIVFSRLLTSQQPSVIFAMENPLIL